MDNTQTAGNSALTGTEDFWKSSIYLPGPGSFDKNDLKYDSQNAVGSYFHSNDGTVGNGGKYIGQTYAALNGVVDIPSGFILCMNVDNRFAEVEKFSNPHSYIPSSDLPLVAQASIGNTNSDCPRSKMLDDTGLVVEYGIGGLNGSGFQWANDSDLTNGNCSDNQSTGSNWYSDINYVPGGTVAVTKTRLRLTNDFTKQEQLNTQVSGGVIYISNKTLLKVKNNTVLGTIVKNYGKYYDPNGAFSGVVGWSGPVPDQIQVVGTRVRVNKTVNNNTLDSINSAPGDETTWYLDSTSDALGAAEGRSNDVKIVDTLPVGLSYNINSSICASVATEANPISCEPGVVVNSNGTTTLTWVYGSFKGGSVMGKINYKTTSDASIINNTTLVNSAEIYASNDNSPVAARTNTASVTFVAAGSFAVQKSVLTPFVPIGDQIKYKLLFKNNGSNSIASSESIDWLPYNGDGRNPVSNYSGKLDFVSLTNTSGVNGTVTYSKYPFANLVTADYDPTTVSGAAIFCPVSAFGTPGCPLNNNEVTGFKIVTGAINPGEESVWELIELPNSNNLDRKNDIITNRYSTKATGLPTTISNNVFATVTAGKIGDTIYKDVNFNGIQDAGDVGIAGVTVTLTRPDGTPVDCDPFIAGVQPCITTTDTNGNYSFDNLPLSTADFPTRGDYKVTVTAPATGNPLVGLLASGYVDGVKDNFTLISLNNENPIGGNGINGRTDLTGDFGYRDPRADISIIKSHTAPVAPKLGFDIGDVVQYKFIVTNNGLDAPARFTLTDGFPANLGNITNWTPSVGTYNSTTGVWSGLTVANFSSLQFITMTVDATVLTSPANGEINNTATVANPKDVIGTAMIDPTTNNTSTDVVKLVSRLTGKVYLDPNYNGVQGAGEPDGSIPAGTSVIIKSTDGSVTYILTLSNGINPDGTYTVQVVPPATYSVSTSTELGDGTGANLTTVVVGPGQTRSQGKDGLYQPAFIEGKVYMDFDNSGTQDVSEPNGAIPAGTTVTITDGTNTFTVPLNADGSYTKEVPPGNYTVTVNPPTGYTVTGGANPTPVTATAGTTTNAGIDGLYSQTTITGQVYLNPDNNGTQDSGEPNGSIPAGTVITITSTTNPAITYTSTINPDGTYSQVVPAGTYTVTVTPPTGYTVSTSTQLGDGTGANATTLTVLPGETKSQGKDGLYQPSSISGFVYKDLSNDGIKDGSEGIIGGVTVKLTGTDVNGNSVNLTAITGSVTGKYKFLNLIPGTYTITEVQPIAYDDGQDTAGTGATTQGAITNDKQTGIVLGSNQNSINNNFGELVPATITGSVYIDFNNNGAQGAGEPNGSIPAGTVVTITSTSNPAITFTVPLNPDGTYSQDLPAGTYTVTVTPPTGYTVSTSTELGAGTGANATTVTVGQGETKSQGKDGLYKPSLISGFVYKDVDDNGILGGPGEIGIATTVTLTGTDINGNTITPITIPSNPTTGAYSFDNLLPGTYTIKETQPIAYSDGQDTLGVGATTQGTLTNDKITGVVLDMGQSSINNNFGEVSFATITGSIYLDSNNNGIQGLSEANPSPLNPLPIGTTVTITDTTNPANTFVVDINPDGTYSQQVPPGSYTVTVTPPPGFVVTISTELGAGTGANATTVTVGAGQTKSQGKDGLYATGVIGNQVWIDTNLDGIYQSTEPAIPNVTVNLYKDLTGNGTIQAGQLPFATTTTYASGVYTFVNLFVEDGITANGPGAKYIVKIDLSTLPTNSAATTPGTPGTNNTNQIAIGTVVTLTPATPVQNFVDFGFVGQPGVKLDKTVYAGHNSGAGCPGVKELTIVDKDKALKNVTYCFKVTNTGSTYLNTITFADPALGINQTNMTLLTAAIPLAPGASATWYYETAKNVSLLNIASVTAIPSLPSGTPTGQTNVTYADNTGAKLIYVFDPPFGIKTGKLVDGDSKIRWTMQWINGSESQANNVVIVDEVPVGTTYQGGLSCVASGTSVVISCEYIAPNSQYPRGAIKATTNISADPGALTAAQANNEVSIIFDVSTPAEAGDIENQAKLTWDANGDGSNDFTVLSNPPVGVGATKVIVTKKLMDTLLRTGGEYLLTPITKPYHPLPNLIQHHIAKQTSDVMS